MSIDAVSGTSVSGNAVDARIRQTTDMDITDENHGSLLSEVFLHPKKIWTKACRAIAGRNRIERKLPLRKSPRKKVNEHKTETNPRPELHPSRKNKPVRTTNRQRPESTRGRREDINHCLVETVVENTPEVGAKEDTTEYRSVEIQDEAEDGDVADRNPSLTRQGLIFYTCRPGTGGYCLCRCREGIPTANGFDHHAASTPMIAFGAGRSFGRMYVPSGTVLLHTTSPPRHQDTATTRDISHTERTSISRAGASTTRLSGQSRTKAIPKRPGDMQRPLSGLSQSASSPLNHDPIRRIDDRHDVLTPDEFFDPENLPLQEDYEDHQPFRERPRGIPHQSEPQWNHPGVEEYVKRVSELELELQLLKTETEIQRREREKYQKLYESAALCQICMERRRNSFILPCSHFVYCGECLDRHWAGASYRRCPMCRGPAHSVIITNLVF